MESTLIEDQATIKNNHNSINKIEDNHHTIHSSSTLSSQYFFSVNSSNEDTPNKDGDDSYLNEAFDDANENDPLLFTYSTNSNHKQRQGSIYYDTIQPSIFKEIETEDEGHDKQYINTTKSSQSEGEKRKEKLKHNNKALEIASKFLLDYEESRSSSLPPDLHAITCYHLYVHTIKYSYLWNVLRWFSCFALFLSSAIEVSEKNVLWLCTLTFVPIIFFCIDIAMQYYLTNQIYMYNLKQQEKHMNEEEQDNYLHHQRISRSQTIWSIPLLIFFLCLYAETIYKMIHFKRMGDSKNIIIWTSIFKPLLFFYISTKARNALDALYNAIFLGVMNAICIEFLFIFVFGILAYQLFYIYNFEDDNTFYDAGVSFVSMFELSTTVVNPSLWMPIYKEDRRCAVFFITFMVLSVFYLHSLGTCTYFCVDVFIPLFSLQIK